MTPLVAWALALMLVLVPRAPWRDTYEATAEGIVDGARAEPVFAGELGVERTIVLDVAVAYFESTYQPDALGDHGRSHGLFQTPIALPASAAEQTRFANRMMRQSFRACAARPFEERLGWYASGGPTCDVAAGLRASRNRVGLALRLFAKHPPTKE